MLTFRSTQVDVVAKYFGNEEQMVTAMTAPKLMDEAGKWVS